MTCESLYDHQVNHTKVAWDARVLFYYSFSLYVHREKEKERGTAVLVVDEQVLVNPFQ